MQPPQPQTFQSVFWCSLVISSFARYIALISLPPNMSSTCDNCDCQDKSQCTKKGYTFQVEGIVESSFNMSFSDCETVQGENDCNCGPGCTCTSCPCHK